MSVSNGESEWVVECVLGEKEMAKTDGEKKVTKTVLIVQYLREVWNGCIGSRRQIALVV